MGLEELHRRPGDRLARLALLALAEAFGRRRHGPRSITYTHSRFPFAIKISHGEHGTSGDRGQGTSRSPSARSRPCACVSFEVAAGEVFGFLGPNGAGKTTTINMSHAGQATGGGALVAGHDVVSERDDVRRHIGLVFQETTLDGYLTASRTCGCNAELYGVEAALVPARMRRCSRWSTSGAPRHARAHLLRRHAPAPGDRAGLMHSPRVLFLDEPTLGLDPQTRSSIWRYIS